ncbi:MULTISPECIES: hypothetical protein [unclassified Streptomyces]|uniref:hypothetical protein n=1 Tax=unclassified Streptomyces TaxID=2593676 RepID=UPI003249591F
MKLKSLGSALTTVVLVGTALTGTVALAGTASAATPDCSSAIVGVKAKQSVKIRKSAKTSATALGVWGKGAKGGLCNDGKAYTGGTYTACGKTSNKWLYGGPNSSNVEGWIPKACINW